MCCHVFSLSRSTENVRTGARLLPSRLPTQPLCHETPTRVTLRVVSSLSLSPFLPPPVDRSALTVVLSPLEFLRVQMGRDM